MSVFLCEHPKMIWNKYIKKDVLVPCGKCAVCQQKKRSQWIARLQQESKCWGFTYMLYLDYNDVFLPRFDFVKGRNDLLVEQQPRFFNRFEFKDVYINLNDFDEIFYDKETNEFFEKDSQYFYERLNTHHLGIPHPSVRDIQNFKKRLATYIQREVSGCYGSFRSAIASEIGPTTFRPHYHGLLFFNDPRIAEKLPSLVRRAWSDDSGHPFGDTNVSPDKGYAASYCAKYITKDYSLPKCYTHPSLSTFFLTSRKPPIGSLLQSKQEVRQIFDDCSPVQVKFTKTGSYSYKPECFPLEKRLMDRLFPKCPLYSEIPSYARTELYKSVIDARGLITSYDEFFVHIMLRAFDIPWTFKAHADAIEYFNNLQVNGIKLSPFSKDTMFSSMVCKMLFDFTTDNSLKRLYDVGCRVWYQSQVFGISFDEYLSHIYRFYDFKYPQFQLKGFYDGINEVTSKSSGFDYHYFYPLSHKEVFFDEKECPREVKSRLEHIRSRKRESEKPHLKNAYLEKLKVRDYVLFNLVNNYYAKECNENVEAVS